MSLITILTRAVKEKPRVFWEHVQVRHWEVRGGFLEKEVPFSSHGKDEGVANGKCFLDSKELIVFARIMQPMAIMLRISRLSLRK